MIVFLPLSAAANLIVAKSHMQGLEGLAGALPQVAKNFKTGRIGIAEVPELHRVGSRRRKARVPEPGNDVQINSTPELSLTSS